MDEEQVACSDWPQVAVAVVVEGERMISPPALRLGDEDVDEEEEEGSLARGAAFAVAVAVAEAGSMSSEGTADCITLQLLSDELCLPS